MDKENLMHKIMDLVRDYGIDSLRVGIYQQRVSFSDYYEKSSEKWKLDMLIVKRDKSEDRLAEEIWKIISKINEEDKT